MKKFVSAIFEFSGPKYIRKYINWAFLSTSFWPIIGPKNAECLTQTLHIALRWYAYKKRSLFPILTAALSQSLKSHVLLKKKKKLNHSLIGRISPPPANLRLASTALCVSAAAAPVVCELFKCTHMMSGVRGAQKHMHHRRVVAQIKNSCFTQSAEPNTNTSK